MQLQYDTAILQSMGMIGYLKPVSEPMLDRAKQDKNSAYYGCYDESDIRKSARMASRLIIESWHKVDKDEYRSSGKNNGLKYNNVYLIPND